MHVRRANRHEVRELTEMGLIKPDQSIRPSDIIFVARHGGFTVGCCIIRPMYYAHSLTIAPDGYAGVQPRVIADALFHHINGSVEEARIGGDSGIAGTLFQVSDDNATMRRFIESKGAVAEPDSILYRFDQIDPEVDK